MAFSAGFDTVFTPKHFIKFILKTKIWLLMVADSQSLYDLHTKATCTTKNCLWNGLQTVKNVCKSLEARNVALFKSKFNSLGALTNFKQFQFW